VSAPASEAGSTPAPGQQIVDARKRSVYCLEAAAWTPYIGAETPDGLVFIVRCSDSLGRSLFAKGGRPEMTLLDRACSLIRSHVPGWDPGNSVFLDVGANIGTTVIPAITRHGFAHAFAFEPEPANFDLLRANIVLNRIDDRIATLQAAVSDELGELTLVVQGSNSGAHYVTDIGAKRPRRSVTVRSLTLSSLVVDGTIDPDRTGLVWMDVQGHEGRVLAGARALVDRRVPIVLEFHPTALELADGLGQVIEAASRYTHLVDLGDPRAELRSAGTIEELSSELLARGGKPGDRYTDILLLSPPE
jgi:FkbM family methyltransferase